MSDIAAMESELLDLVRAEGIWFDGPIIFDGKKHPFDEPGKPGKGNWYIAHGDPPANITIQCFRLGGPPLKLKAANGHDHGPVDYAAIAEQAEASRARSAAKASDAAKAADKAAQAASNLVEARKPAPDDHPMLTSRGLTQSPPGVRAGLWAAGEVVERNALIVPLRNEAGEVRSVQAIYPDPERPGKQAKRFVKNGQKTGCFAVLGDLESAVVVVLCEGFITTGTVWEAMLPDGWCAVMGIDAGNLPAVAEIVRRLVGPDKRMVIGSDNDRFAKKNDGLIKATQAALAVGALLAVPQFLEGEDGTDFNDLLRLRGLAAVRETLLAASEPTPLAPEDDLLVSSAGAGSLTTGKEGVRGEIREGLSSDAARDLFDLAMAVEPDAKVGTKSAHWVIAAACRNELSEARDGKAICLAWDEAKRVDDRDSAAGAFERARRKAGGFDAGTLRRMAKGKEVEARPARESTTRTFVEIPVGRGGERIEFVFEVPGLLAANARGELRIVDSIAAERIAPLLAGRVGRCEETGEWHAYDAEAGCWRAVSDDSMSRIVHALLVAGSGYVGFTDSKRVGTMAALAIDGSMAIRQRVAGDALPFRRKMLNVATGEIIDTTPGNALRWALPFEFDASAKCPMVDWWLDTVSGGNGEKSDYLRCVAAAVVRGIIIGKRIHKYFLLKGPPRSGKGTFIRLLSALVGEENVYSAELSALADRFESAAYVDKRLVVFEDATGSKAAAERFKKMTGGDAFRVERKFKAPSSRRFEGAIVVAANNPIDFGDMSGAINARRCVIDFDRNFSQSEIAKWLVAGGEGQLLKEAAGFVQSLLSISEQRIVEALTSDPPQCVSDANDEEEAAVNPIAAMFECGLLVPDPDHSEPVGKREIVQVSRGGSGAPAVSHRVYVGAGDEEIDALKGSRVCLYPLFLRFCDEAGIDIGRSSINKNNFSSNLVGFARQRGWRAKRVRTVDGTKILGVRIVIGNSQNSEDHVLGVDLSEFLERLKNR